MVEAASSPARAGHTVIGDAGRRATAGMKKVAHSLCPPLVWNLASRARTLRKRNTKHVIHGVEMILPPSHYLVSSVGAMPYYDTLLPEFLKFLGGKHLRELLVVDVGA